MKRPPLMLIRCLPVTTLRSLLGARNDYISLGSPIGNAFLIGGTLFGPSDSQSTVSFNSGRDSLTLVINGPFVFDGLMPLDGSYVVTIGTQPVSANHVVTNGSGRVNDDANDVQVTCQPR